MTDQTKDTALAKREPAGTIELVSPTAFNTYVADMQRRAHVLSPVTQIGSLPPMWKIIPAVVYLNPDPAAGEVYQDPLFCKEGEVAPTKVALRRLAQAGGMDTGATRIDDGRIQHYWSFQGYIKYRGFDGQRKTHTASVEWDLREGSEEVKRLIKAAEKNTKRPARVTPREWAAKQIDAMRRMGYRNGEARATNAAIREFGLRQKYTQRELEDKPFVVFNMVANPDMTDPEQRRMVLQHALGGEALLYPHAPALTAGEPPIDEPAVNHATGEIIESDPSVPAGPAQPAAKAFDDEDDTETVYHVTNVFEQGDKLWITTQETKDLLIYVGDRETAKALNRAKKAGTGVTLELEKRGADTWVLEVSGAKEKL